MLPDGDYKNDLNEIARERIMDEDAALARVQGRIKMVEQDSDSHWILIDGTTGMFKKCVDMHDADMQLWLLASDIGLDEITREWLLAQGFNDPAGVQEIRPTTLYRGPRNHD